MITWGRLWLRNLLVMYTHCFIIIHNPFISVYIPLCFDDLRIDVAVATQNINHPPRFQKSFFWGSVFSGFTIYHKKYPHVPIPPCYSHGNTSFCSFMLLYI